MKLKQPIRLFVDAHVFDGEFQGTLTYLKELYLIILSKYPEVNVIFGANDLNNVKNIFGKYSNSHFVKYKSKNNFCRIFIECPKIINEYKCTHAHFQYTIPFFNKNKRCQYIVTIHDILFNDFPEEFSLFYRFQRNIMFYLSAKFSNYLFTVSNYSKEKISRHYNIPNNKINITPNAVSEEFFTFAFSKEESKKIISKMYNINNYILYISRVEPRKNQILLLKIYRDLKLWKKGYSLVFIGKNSIETNLKYHINKLDKEAQKNVFWIEQVDFAILKHFLNGAEVFVYPSKAEGFGIPPLEAAALKTPVLCSSTTAMQDFDFFKPYTFDPEKYDDFKEKLNIILKNLNNIDILKIQKEVYSKYSWEKSANVLMKKVLN